MGNGVEWWAPIRGRCSASLRFEPFQQQGAGLRDAARAEGEDHVAFTGIGGEAFDGFGH